MIKVSIIIVNYNTKSLTSDCIESIYKHTIGIDFEIIVVDNFSADDSICFLENRFPEITIISSKENVGFGRANNEAAKVAKGEYLLLLNSDTLFLNDALSSFYSEAIRYSDTMGCIGAYLYNENGEICHSYGVFPSIGKEMIHLFYPIYKHFRKNNNCELADVEREVDYVTGASLFIKKSLFDMFKGFDPDFFMYFEETDLQYRINKAGYRVYISNKPKIVHLEGKSNSCSNNKRIMFEKSLLLYFKKNNSICKYYLYKLLKFLIFGVVCVFNKYTLSENWKYFKKVIL